VDRLRTLGKLLALAVALTAVANVAPAAAASFNGIELQATVVTVDTTSSSATIRVDPLPRGSFATSPDSNVLNQDVVIYTSTNNGSVAHDYRSGSFMDPFETTVPLQGDTSTYPFHHLSLEFDALATGAGGVKSGKSVALQVELSSTVAGYGVSPNPATKQGDLVRLNLHVDPAWETILFAVFMMVVMWALGIAALVVAISLVRRRRRFEGSFMAFLATLLFAFPTVRNALPGIPPVGVLFDYASFFWGEALVAIALITLITGWAVRSLIGTGER
jgi:hypothetical protein